LGHTFLADGTATNKELIKLGHIILGRLSALSDSMRIVKKIIEIGCWHIFIPKFVFMAHQVSICSWRRDTLIDSILVQYC